VWTGRLRRASGSCPPGDCPGGAEVMRRFAPHNFRGSHDQTQTKPKAATLSTARKDRQAPRHASDWRLIVQISRGSRYQHARIIAMLRMPTVQRSAAIMTVSDCQQHSVLAFLAGISS